MDQLTAFLQQQKILQIAPHAGDPWIANVYMGCESPAKIYFVGSRNTLYGQQLSEDASLAFATAWHASDNHLDRKAIQGVGTARIAENQSDIETGVRLHNQNYPEFAERITVDWIHTNERESKVWIITPTFIKHWDDTLYGQDGTETFTFSA